MEMIAHRIAGTSTTGRLEGVAPVHDPATGEQTAEVVLAGVAEVDRAVRAAAEAFQNWGELPLMRRQRIFFDYRQLLLEHRDDLARLVVSQHGKTLDDARGEVQRGIEVVEFACGLPQLLKGESSEQVSTGGVDMNSSRFPLGVCAGITPFNFPVMVPMWMFPMAIACGNTFVLKPSEKDPSASVLAAELFERAGLPAGVLNVVHGDATAVDRLLEHPDVAAVSFVGSTPIARHVYETGTRHGKRVQALGGAKNHMVVLPDADLDLAADAAVSSAFGSAGERCMAVSVVVAVRDVGDELVTRISERAAGLRVGPGVQADAQMGPLITSAHRDRVLRYIDEGVGQGAQLVLDGRGVEVPGHEGGYFVGPTVFDRVEPDLSIYQEEIFGPVLCVARCSSFDEAVELINGHVYGNGVAVFTQNGGAARRFQREVEIGMVGVNMPIPVPLAFYSFGGWKTSMFGAHDIYGPAAVDFYSRQKTVVTKWPEPTEGGLDLVFPTHG